MRFFLLISFRSRLISPRNEVETLASFAISLSLACFPDLPVFFAAADDVPFSGRTYQVVLESHTNNDCDGGFWITVDGYAYQ
ncbi:hypothetical protein ACMX2M_07695 [Paenibacillus polymyxa]